MTSKEAMQILDRIASTPGANAKKAILKQYPALKTILYYALNPYLTYGVTDPGIAGQGDDTFLSINIRLLLDRLSVREITGNAAIELCQNAQRVLDPDSARLFGMILNKDPRIGMGIKTINQVWPRVIPNHEVMLAKGYEPHRVKFPCIIEPKLDGLRATYINGQLLTRKGLPLAGLDHILEELKEFSQYEWDGEVTIPGQTFQQCSGQLRSAAKCPDAVFTIFAARDKNERFFHFDFHTEHVSLISAFQCHSFTDIDAYYQRFRDQGFEGAIIKPVNGKYQFKRSYDWMKLKPKETYDLVVTGKYEGEGKYAGMLGGLIVDYKGQPNGVGTGFSDRERQEFWTDDSLIGQKIEVEFMEETDGGNLRHSRFKGIRWDK